MVEFNLRRVLPSANWVSVTVDMAPDEIEYTVTTPTKSVHQQDSLTALVALYAYTEDENNTSAKSLATFDVEQANGQVWLAGRVFSDPLVIDGGLDQIQSALRPLLAEVYHLLDEQSSTTEREEALRFLSDELHIHAEELYADLLFE